MVDDTEQDKNTQGRQAGKVTVEGELLAYVLDQTEHLWGETTSESLVTAACAAILSHPHVRLELEVREQ